MENKEIRETLIDYSSESSDILESFDHMNTYVRVLAFSFFNIIWQITELNTFFQMQIFDVPANHPLVVGRILLIGLIAAPLIPEYLAYIKQKDMTNLSPLVWLFITIALAEAFVNIRYEPYIMAHVQFWYIILWLIILVIYTV